MARVNPDAHEAFQVTPEAVHDLLGMAAALDGYCVEVNLTIQRVAITRAGSETQFANCGDWLVVTDATVVDGLWTVQPTSRVLVYSASYSGVAGTVEEFHATFQQS